MGNGQSSDNRERAENDRQRITDALENWKRKLLDLSKRNRALNFKMNKVSTIAVVDEQPAEVFRQLYLKEGAMRFKAAPETADQPSLIEGGQPIRTPDATAAATKQPSTQ